MFKKHERNPIYGDGETGTLFDVYVTRRAEGGLRMDFSQRKNGSVAVAFSSDGINWTAPRVTLFPDPSSGWEDEVNRNCVLRIGAGYKMWYTGQARGYSFIGVCESDDGLVFRRVGDGPALFPERPWEGASVMNPCVLYEDGIYRMWYSAGETYEPNAIGYAESDDGVVFRKAPVDPIFVCEEENEFERDRIGGCQVVPHEKLGYLMFYIGYRDIDTACICCAASQNGVTGFKRYKKNPLVSPSPDGWDKSSCYKPSALRDEAADVWRIWYNGRNGNTEYIGLAERTGDFSPEDFE